jgi:hypothetical protein
VGEAALQSVDQTLAPAGSQKPRKGNKHASGYDILRCLQLRDEGLTAKEIGAKLSPPKHQTSVSAILRKWGHNTVADAKRLLQAAAADMAVDVVERGRPQDKVAALKGLRVLDDTPDPPRWNIGSINISHVKLVHEPTFAPNGSTVSDDMHKLSDATGSDN